MYCLVLPAKYKNLAFSIEVDQELKKHLFGNK